MLDPVKINKNQSLIKRLIFNKYGRIDDLVWIVCVWLTAMFLIRENVDGVWIMTIYTIMISLLAFPRWKNILNL
jgi:hypothetical protein